MHSPAGVTASHVYHTALAAVYSALWWRHNQSALWRHQSALHCSQRPVRSDRHGWWTLRLATLRLVYWLTQHTPTQSTSSPNSAKYISIFALLIAQNPTEFWQNSPYNTANSWWHTGDENHLIKLHQIRSNRENTITGRKTRTNWDTGSSVIAEKPRCRVR